MGQKRFTLKELLQMKIFPTKHPLLESFETLFHFQPAEKKGKVHHRINLEDDDPSFNIEAIDREEGIMLAS